MSVQQKAVRIYDLSRELKQDTKRIIEEARREGIDVSVASNSIPKEVAEKIRLKYFPKKETATTRAVKVVKKTHSPEEVSSVPKTESENSAEIKTERPEESTIPVKVAPLPSVTPQMPATTVKNLVVKPLPKPAITPAKPSPVSPTANVAQPKKIVSGAQVAKLLKKDISAEVNLTGNEKRTEEAVEGAASEVSVITETPIETSPEASLATETAQVEETSPPTPETIIAPKPKSAMTSPIGSGTQVRTLRLTKEALQAGLKPGEKVIVEPPPKPAVAPPQKPARFEKPRFESRSGRGGKVVTAENRRSSELRATPGEIANPQTVYTPTANNRKPGRGGKKFVKPDGKGGKFQQEERDLLMPKHLPIDVRLQQQLGVTKTSELKEIRLVEGATVRDFAEKVGVAPRDIVQLLLKRGILATLNQPLNTEVAIDIGKTLGADVTFVPFEEMIVEQEFEDLIAADADDVELPRAPVVTVMGHVDHGKTSLLDAIRKANVVAGEAGGITQHIGAYSVQVPNPDNPEEKRRVVFLDTPGHEAFTMMRARGAKATDVVVLVVAADDGVMPQTIEAIEHSKAAKVPIVVAVNKIDKPEANVDKVKTELSAHGLQPVDWGGDTEIVEVSAKKKQNLDTLLETILLTADILELKASPTRLASGVVLEAKLDKGRGSVATVLVQQGTLHIGTPFIVGNYFGRVRAMFSDTGQSVDSVEPSTPVEVLGLQGVPQAGDIFQVVSDIDRAQQISNQRLMQARQAALVQSTRRGLDSLAQADLKELLVVLKADVQGSVEVLRATLEKLSTEKVKVRVIRSGVGAITESDILLASATQADNAQTAVVIIGFNTRPESRASELAKSEDVDIRLHSIIYKVEEEIRAAMIGMLDAIEKETILGKAEVREVFKVSKVGTIAGCGVMEGIIKRQARARLIRDGVVIWEGEISSLKRFKEDASEVRQGYECGIGLLNFNDIKVADQIEAYIVEKIAPTTL